MNAVDAEEIENFDALAAHADEWRRIAADSERATVFQTWEWTRAWWTHYGKNKRLWAMRFRDGANVVGFGALFLPPAGVPLRAARLVGDGGSDYLDFLALPGYEARVTAAFYDVLNTHRKRWDFCDLSQTRPGSVLDTGLEHGAHEIATGSGVRVQPLLGETCPFLSLPHEGGWDAFRKTLGKKMRSNVGYYERNLGKLYEVEYRLATPQTLADDMSAFYDLHQARWNKRWLPGAFATRRARAFHDDAARALLDAGYLRLHTLSLDGEIEAALYCFHKTGRTYYYLGGFAPEMAKFSVGTVLTAQAIRHAIEADGATEFDFLRGDEPYKYKWNAQDRHNQRLFVTRRGVLRPLLLSTGGRVSLAVERRLKTWMHAKHGGGGAKPATLPQNTGDTQNG